MEKNKRVLIVLGILIVGIGISLAYFVGKMLTGGEGATTKVLTANIKNSEVTIEGILNIEDYDMLPGHQSASGIKVNAKGNNELIPFNIIWEGTNTLGSKLKFKVYKSSSRLTVDIKCNEVRKPTGGGTMLYEECSINSEEELGEVIQEGEIPISEVSEKVNIALDQFITSTEEPGTDIYYYVIIEYPNEDKIQNDDMLDKSFKGELKIEASETEADVNIFAAYIEQEDGSYEKVEDIPQEGYTINKDKSKCSNGAIPNWDISNKRLYIDNFKKIGTECYLYFEKEPAKDIILMERSINEIQIPFTGPDKIEHKTTNNKSDLYISEDDLGNTYYFRGIVNDNWIKFGQTIEGKDLYWRIIRINGNGSIRIIYNGTSTEATGSNTQLSSTSAFNSDSGDNMYVGYMYGSSSDDYTTTHANDNKSTILKELERWFVEDTNLDDLVGLLDKEAGFCNDREVKKVGSYYTGNGTGTLNTSYAPYVRLTNGSNWDNQTPTFKCSQNNDNFTVVGSSNGNQKLTYPVGLITSDEVVYAGGTGGSTVGISNTSYYLYTGEYYWTMSPCHFDTVSSDMFFVDINGNVNGHRVLYSRGVRPVINLSANIKLSGDGTYTNPYVVENT